MNPYAIIAAIVLGVALFTGGYFKGRHDEAAIAVEHERDALIEYAKRITQGVTQHDTDQIVISRLRTQLDGVRIHLPTTCPGAADSDEASRIFSERVDEEFGRLQEVARRLFQEADQLNIDAIRSNKIASP